MRVQCDDELYRVNRTFLGPAGRPWPLRATYRAWGIALVLFFAATILWRLIGLPWHVMLAAVFAAGAYPLAKWLDRHLTVDRPVAAEVARAVQEFVAPRPDLHPQAVTHTHHLQVKRWRADAQPDDRWWARFGAWLGAVPARVTRVMTGRRDGRVYEQGEWRNVR